MAKHIMRKGAFAVEETTYFEDGKRKIDVILVYMNKANIEREEFLTHLQEQKIQIERTKSLVTPGRMFVKVHAPDDVLLKYIHVFGLEEKFQQEIIIPYNYSTSTCCQTPLTDPNPHPDEMIARRAWPIISREPPTTFTNAERSRIVFAIMQYIKFGKDTDRFKVGIADLLNRKVFIGAYPLHDGKWEWTNDHEEPLNARQLLARYWASCCTFYKAQPYYHIEDYFGPEIAMYFAFLGFYNTMLLLASFAGISTFAFGFYSIYYITPDAIANACASTLHLCPVCKTCKPKELSYFCFSFHISYLFDNTGTVLYSLFMAFWATFFMEFWKRKTNLLNIMWGIREINEFEENYRAQFQATVKQSTRHSFTGEEELFVHPSVKFYKLTISVTVIALMVLIIAATIIAVISYETVLKRIGIHPVIIILTSSFITLGIMKQLHWAFRSIAYGLTNMENPRTEMEFDKSFLLKTIVFSVVNSYSKMVYIAFFKGKFFTYPGDEIVRNSWFPLSSDVCDPAGCVADLFIFSCVINLCRPIIDNVLEYICPTMKAWYRRKCKRKMRSIPSWEQDFELSPITRYTVMSEVAEMVLQYGFVVLVSASFPLAPLCALVNNIFEIKIDATKLLKFHRRAEAVKIIRMGVWFDTLQAITYFSVITNALYIALSSNFVPKQIYYFEKGYNFSEFYLFQMSKYANKDNLWPNTNITECMYTGHRYPPEDEHAYELTHMFYYVLSYRLAFCITFMIVVFGCTAVLAYAIPDIPKKVKDFISYNEHMKLKNNVREHFNIVMNR